MSENTKISLLNNYVSRLLSTGPYNPDTFSEICLTLYALDLYGFNVSELLRKLRLLLENNISMWISFSVDLTRVNPDAISAIFLLSLKYDKEFAERLRYIAEDVIGFQMPDGRIIMGDHLGLTRLLINMLGIEHKGTIKALDYIIDAISRTDSMVYIIEAAYTLSYTHDLVQRFRKPLRVLANKILSAQLDNGSWNNNITLTSMAARFLIMIGQKVYKDEIERSMKWLKEKAELQGLKINEIREIMIRLKELEVSPTEINLPMVIIDADEIESIEELIYKASRSMLLVNTPPNYIVQVIKNIVTGKQFTLRLLVGPQSDKQTIEELLKMGFVISETDLPTNIIIIDDEIVIFYTNLQNHNVFIALKQKGLEEILLSRFKK